VIGVLPAPNRSDRFGKPLDRFWQQWRLKSISSAIKLLQQATRPRSNK
jgi:hypothetical protein